MFHDWIQRVLSVEGKGLTGGHSTLLGYAQLAACSHPHWVWWDRQAFYTTPHTSCPGSWEQCTLCLRCGLLATPHLITYHNYQNKKRVMHGIKSTFSEQAFVLNTSILKYFRRVTAVRWHPILTEVLCLVYDVIRLAEGKWIVLIGQLGSRACQFYSLVIKNRQMLKTTQYKSRNLWWRKNDNDVSTKKVACI